MADLLVAAREEQDPARLRDLVARAIGDPRAGLAWWDRREARYLDHQGRPVEPVPGEVIAVETSGVPLPWCSPGMPPRWSPACATPSPRHCSWQLRTGA